MRSITAAAGALLICTGAVGFAVGCADDTQLSWENPDVPWEQWRIDKAECRAAAEERAERDFALRQFESPPTGGYSRNEPVVSSLNQFDANKQIERLFAQCMRDRGYKSVARSREE